MHVIHVYGISFENACFIFQILEYGTRPYTWPTNQGSALRSVNGVGNHSDTVHSPPYKGI